MTSILTVILNSLARIILWRRRPQLVAVTGNAGKTSTRNAIAAVLRKKYSVRSTAGNMNTELGIAAAVIGDFSERYSREGGTPAFWFGVLAAGLKAAAGVGPYPEILVLEYGADKPGDIKTLAHRYPPHVAIVTQIGDVPVHIEFFASAQHLAEEKSALLKVLSAEDHAVLNADDMTVLDMRHSTQAHIHTFGLATGADLQASDITIVHKEGRPTGISFDLHSSGAIMPVNIRGTIGRGIATASAAAAAVGQLFGVGLADAAEALSEMTTPPGRMRLLDGIKGALIIDDTYNASPAAMHLAIDAVRELRGRKFLVLGDMLELGEHSLQAHQAVGTMAAGVADLLICVGARGRIMADSARNQMPADKVLWFDDSTLAAPEVQKLIQPGDVVLVKGSQGVRMERVVKEVMADPARANGLLVRQSILWLNK